MEKKKRAKAIFMGAGKVVLGCLLVAGVGVVACVAPNLFVAFDKLFSGLRNPSGSSKKEYTPKEKKAIQSTFDYLRRRGYIRIRRVGRQIYISLTKEGKKRAGRFQIDSLLIKPQARWDRKWRILLFDVPQSVKLSREALRGKLKELGFALFQKSVWIHAFKCEKEIELLRNFFGLQRHQVSLLETHDIGTRTGEMRRVFKV